jgi:hypothetical protein
MRLLRKIPSHHKRAAGLVDKAEWESELLHMRSSLAHIKQTLNATHLLHDWSRSFPAPNLSPLEPARLLQAALDCKHGRHGVSQAYGQELDRTDYHDVVAAIDG